jgi:energy-coupling factor transporter ATP-binding protein EcfA2
MTSLLDVRGLTAGYDGVAVLHGVDLQVRAGTICVVLGANGAGKTTLLRVLSGLVRPDVGRIVFEGTELSGVSVSHIKYNNGVPFDATVEYGLSVGYLFVQALRAAGQDLTRQGITQATEKGGFTGPGLAPLRYSKDDHSGYGGLQMGQVKGGKQLLFGPVYTTDDATGPITPYTAPPAAPPTNAIPA